MLYLILIPASGALLLFGNFFAGGNFTWAAFGWEFARVGAAMAGAFAIDGLLALLIRRLPARWFAPLAPLFSVGKRELKLYRFLRLPAWKNGVPEWGGFTSFRKNRLASPSDPAYLARFLLESNYGVAIHLAGALAGFALLAVPFVNARLSVALPVACLNALFSLMPMMILRFHTPTLRRLYRRAVRRTEGEKCVGKLS